MRARLTIVLLALFVAFDVVLVTLAVRHTSTIPVAEAGPVSAPPSDATLPSASPSRSIAAKPSGSTSSAPAIPPNEPVFLAVGVDGAVLRATRGDCEASRQPAVSVSSNRGAVFRDRSVEGLTEVLRVEALGNGSLSLVGRNTACAVENWTSIDAGRSWSQAFGAPQSWYLAANPRQSVVFAPTGRKATPCAPTGVSSIGSDVVRVLCADGQVLGTSDGGSSWVTLGRLDGAVSIRFTSPGEGVALAAQDGCPAAVMETSDGGATWDRQICLDGENPRAIGAAGDLVVAQVGDVVDVSTDGGASWPGASG